MSKLADNLLVEKARPRELSQVVLCGRVRKILEQGLTKNIMLYSNSPGTGKSTISDILCKDKPLLKINASEQRGIDVVRTLINDFVHSQAVGFDDEKYKVIWLEEFDNATIDFQKALRAVMEDCSDRVRFICTLNYINKIEPAIRSRFNIIHLMAETPEEVDELKEGMYKRIVNISNQLGLEWENEELCKAYIDKFYPDMRSMISGLQDFKDTGNKTITFDLFSNQKEKIHSIYKFFTKKYHIVDIIKFVQLECRGIVNDVFEQLTSDFPMWVIKQEDENIKDKLIYIIPIIKDHDFQRKSMVNQEFALISCIASVSNLYK